MSHKSQGLPLWWVRTQTIPIGVGIVPSNPFKVFYSQPQVASSYACIAQYSDEDLRGTADL